MLKINFKLHRTFVIIPIFFALAFLIPQKTQAVAEETVNIKLQIKTFDATLYDNVINVSACETAPSITIFTFNAWCALTQVANEKNWAIANTWGEYGVFLQALNQYDGTDGNWWLWYSNSEPGATALNLHELTNNETVLLTYNINPLKISVDNANPTINSTSTITSSYFDPMSWSWLPANDVKFVINGQTDETNKTDGIYELWANTTSPYIINATKTGYLDSSTTTIAAQLPTANIQLRIETASSTILNQTLNISACENSLNSRIYTINGKCAVEQSGILNNWSWWGDDAFLNSISEYANDYTNNIYWNWFGDLEYGQTALNKHTLSADEKLLLVYNINPLKITAPETNILNTTSTITSQQFDLDASWNPTWTPATSGTIVINGENFETENGTYDLLLTTTTPYIIYGQKTGYLNSEIFTITASPPADDDNGNEDNNSPCSSCGSSQTEHHNLNTNKAIEFLTAQQNADGSFESTLYTDWAAIALATTDETTAKEKIKQYLQTDPNPIAGLNAVSDYARRAMALMSLGINPYNGVNTNYIRAITDRFDGNQFGDVNLHNDDIFALIPLLKAGYDNTDPMIINSTNFILSKQNTNGDWGSADLTAAAIQTLSSVQNIDGVTSALIKGKEYLQTQQQADGGWGNTFATSWAMQAISSLGENQAQWLKNEKTPEDFLYSKQADDGGLDLNAPTTSRIWASAYAIPAALNKPWPQIINSFSKPNEENLNNNDNTTYIVSSTLETTDLTANIVTSTDDITFTTTTITTTTINHLKNEDKKEDIQNQNNLLTTEDNPLSILSQPVITTNYIKKELAYESTTTQNLSANTIPESTLLNIATELPIPRRAKNVAKTVAVVSASGAGAMGLYLGLKLLKNML